VTVEDCGHGQATCESRMSQNNFTAWDRDKAFGNNSLATVHFHCLGLLCFLFRGHGGNFTVYNVIITMCPRVPDPQCGRGVKSRVKWACLKWLFLFGMSLVAKVKKTTYLLGSVTQILKQASFSVDKNKHRTMHAWQKHDSVFTHQ